jgi:gliding motility-associated-like protein
VIGTGKWSVILGTGTISNDSIVSNLSGGENKFEWTITNGVCISKDQMIIMVHDLLIPEGFSPNDDMINDEFVIQGLDIAYCEVSLRILNSAGTEVFFTSNTDGNTLTKWNGENGNGILPEGTYYYLLTIKSTRNGTVYKKSGFIILKRYNTQ